jgi:hypothetical protein
MRLAALALGLAGAATLVAGCQSTQSKSAELAKEGSAAVSNEQGLKIGKKSRDVKVSRALVLSDANGGAAVVELRNTGKKTLVNVPIAIDVRKGGKSVFANDAPGLEQSLVSVAALRPGESLAWVNDQVFATGPKIAATVGATKRPAPAKLPEIDVGPPKFGGDPTSGIAVEGRVTNRSKLLQRKLVIYAVARKGGKVVAAGRGQVERLKAGASAGYQIFFIGNPEGAQVELAAPPTTFQ